MKKRIVAWSMMLVMVGALLAGCSGGGSGESEDSGSADGQQEETNEEEKEQEELLSWLKEGSEKLNEEPLWGTKEESTIEYEDGTSEVTQIFVTVDTQNQIMLGKYIYPTNDQISYYTVEDGKEYEYFNNSVWDDSGNETIEPLKVLVPEDQFGYSKLAVGPDFSYKDTDWMKYEEVKVTNEGEEDGMIKIKIEEKYKNLSLSEKITRESALEEQGLTEEDLSYVGGASEALDTYIAKYEAASEAEKEKVYENTFYYWITKDEHSLVKLEYSDNQSEQFEPSFVEFQEAEGAFLDLAWKIPSVKDLVENQGMSSEEALNEVNSWQGETEPQKKQTGYTYKVTWVKGEECEPIGELPQPAKELTWEQYENGEY